ncbi:unnamed protein product [Paramecium primaurelia]|uniref:Uncharacterized protein n=1 Tax=Paramecium primaurelia TaxID=5886 RepID=A0A8S1M9W6_PARPR|nr:unnamed protein product [Paramecium primaurelia]
MRYITEFNSEIFNDYAVDNIKYKSRKSGKFNKIVGVQRNIQKQSDYNNLLYKRLQLNLKLISQALFCLSLEKHEINKKLENEVGSKKPSRQQLAS